MREWSWKLQASPHGLVFLVTRPHPESIQELTMSCLIRTKDTSITQEIPRNLRALCQELGQRPNIRIQDAPSTSITWEITKILGVWDERARRLGMKTNIYYRLYQRITLTSFIQTSNTFCWSKCQNIFCVWPPLIHTTTLVKTIISFLDYCQTGVPASTLQ